MTQTTQMRREIDEIPSAVDRLLTQGKADIARVAAEVTARDPHLIATIARGSSDHACTYLKYVSELHTGLPVASIGPSVASIYGAKLRLDGSLCIAVSQSGKSPDIVEMARSACRDGAYGVAITNDPASPLAEAMGATLALHAGPELSVAATKTFVTSAIAGLCLLAAMRPDAALDAAIAGLPEVLEQAAQITWPELRAAIEGRNSLYTLGRGPAWAMSNEAALKFKETCQIHAESYSSAEVLHGPVSIVEQGFPVLGLAAQDAGGRSLAQTADRLAGTGAQVFVTSQKVEKATVLETVRTGHSLCDPISLIVSFYATVERIAAERGIDPDTPRHLKKVTETV